MNNRLNQEGIMGDYKKELRDYLLSKIQSRALDDVKDTIKERRGDEEQKRLKLLISFLEKKGIPAKVKMSDDGRWVELITPAWVVEIVINGSIKSYRNPLSIDFTEEEREIIEELLEHHLWSDADSENLGFGFKPKFSETRKILEYEYHLDGSPKGKNSAVNLCKKELERRMNKKLD